MGAGEQTEGSGAVAVALRFLAVARSDMAVRARLAALNPSDGINDVVAVAADAGFRFRPAELRTAFVYDWGLRRAGHIGSGSPLDPPEGPLRVHTGP